MYRDPIAEGGACEANLREHRGVLQGRRVDQCRRAEGALAQLFRRADANLYRAKQNGRNRAELG